MTDMAHDPTLDPYFSRQESLADENQRARSLLNVTIPWCATGVAFMVAGVALGTLWRLMPLKEVVTPVVAYEPGSNKMRVFDDSEFIKLSSDEARRQTDIHEWVVNAELRDTRLTGYQDSYLYGRSAKGVFSEWRTRRDADLAIDDRTIVKVRVTGIKAIAKQHNIYLVDFYRTSSSWSDADACQRESVNESDCVDEVRAWFSAKIRFAYGNKPLAMATAWKNPGAFVVLEYDATPGLPPQ